MDSVQIKNNVATVDLPHNIPVGFTVKTNSPSTQKVTVSNKNEEKFVFKSSGESNQIGSQQIKVDSEIKIRFEFFVGNELWLESALRSGVPYEIATSRFLIRRNDARS